MPRAKQTRGLRSATREQPDPSDADLTKTQWKKFKIQDLRKKCRDLHLLTTGRHGDLVDRLFDKYHPIVPPSLPRVNLGDEEDDGGQDEDEGSTLPYDNNEEQTNDDGNQDTILTNESNEEQNQERNDSDDNGPRIPADVQVTAQNYREYA